MKNTLKKLVTGLVSTITLFTTISGAVVVEAAAPTAPEFGGYVYSKNFDDLEVGTTEFPDTYLVGAGSKKVVLPDTPKGGNALEISAENMGVTQVGARANCFKSLPFNTDGKNNRIVSSFDIFRPVNARTPDIFYGIDNASSSYSSKQRPSVIYAGADGKVYCRKKPDAEYTECPNVDFTADTWHNIQVVIEHIDTIFYTDWYLDGQLLCSTTYSNTVYDCINSICFDYGEQNAANKVYVDNIKVGYTKSGFTKKVLFASNYDEYDYKNASKELNKYDMQINRDYVIKQKYTVKDEELKNRGGLLYVLNQDDKNLMLAVVDSSGTLTFYRKPWNTTAAAAWPASDPNRGDTSYYPAKGAVKPGVEFEITTEVLYSKRIVKYYLNDTFLGQSDIPEDLSLIPKKSGFYNGAATSIVLGKLSAFFSANEIEITNLKAVSGNDDLSAISPLDGDIIELNVVGTINNTTSESKSIAVILAVYKDKTMQDICYRTVTVPGNSALNLEDLTGDAALKLSVDSTSTVKVMCWDTIENCKPLTSAYEGSVVFSE